ncbi:DNA-binding transcription factor [Schizosaccharomyces pombe]|uniref:Uncharacterized transcriptional regulatory protein C777.02 n=1 Tax=Schizosaccharomyces pombe (strain 972 / ATCC 24843) TaxID=284812 RepID=YCV2_SCHPO|nr:putative transcription factor [Schizosaccharomyces pombe]O74541.4 RecName: Full=Uncharacterized transcriptional regulatory protein C777.02 [Schizosaccharomyces pombe 972h-]CAA20706.4 transcription factor (predicted) [Schizosaccharomyces pombe]|eukprot:NP_588248.3 putative transcription factor [Schizosaccharomyces pombe]
MNKLSCLYCRRRKIKCDKNRPCHNCFVAKRECIIAGDNRKKRHTKTYVEALESQLANMESTLAKIKVAPVEKIPSLLAGISFKDHLSASLPNKTSYEQADTNATSKSLVDLPVSLEVRGRNTVTFYGPTSIFGTSFTSSPRPPPSASIEDTYPIIHCLQLFFKWQYAQFLFIHRESFLFEYFHRSNDNMYCSEHLIYALCAIGCRSSEDSLLVNQADAFYKMAWDALESYGLENSHITSAQCLLCLGFYKIAMGNTSHGWLLCGMAFRMGQDLGFHLDPRDWHINNVPVVSEEQAALRSRIYWGCYVADVFVSFILGRPTTLSKSDTSVPTSDDLPDFSGIEDFMLERGGAHASSITISQLLNLIVSLSNITDAILLNVFAPYSTKYGIDLRLQNVGKYNLELMKWHFELPPNLSWKKTELRDFGQSPELCFLCLYFFLIRLCLNRPFLSKKGLYVNDMTPRNICIDSIEDVKVLIRAYRENLGLHHTPLIIVYACIVSCSTVFMLFDGATPSEIVALEQDIKFFLHVLTKISKNWDLASKSINLIQKKSTMYDTNARANDTDVDFSNDKQNTHDFQISHDENLIQLFNDESNFFNLNDLGDFQSIFGGPQF